MGENTNPDIPDEVVDKVVSFTIRSRNENNGNLLKKRDQILREYNYVARVREEDDTLVLYPSDWIGEDGNADLGRIESTGNAIEVSLSGPQRDANWEDVEDFNSRIVSRVSEEYSSVHASNVRAFADFMGSYYLKRVTDATKTEKDEFVEEYYIRNVWSSEEQEDCLEESLRILEEVSENIEEY